MESINKLRTAARNMAKGSNLANHEECNLLLIIADEIEREIAERYMRLPVDADGVPIHCGDMLKYGDYSRGIVKALNTHMVVVMRVDEDNLNYAKYGLLWEAEGCRHVKPDPLKELLEDFGNEVARRGHQAGLDMPELVDEFAPRFKELGKAGA